MLTFENISKTYGDKVLFDNISAVIEPTDRIGLIGVNGTGKSTLLKIIAGKDTAETGEFHHRKAYKIEYLAQDPELDDTLTVMEQIYYGDSTIMKAMRAYEKALYQLEQDPANENYQANLLETQEKMDKEAAWEANTVAKTILSKLGITEIDKNISSLSGGQRKRVAIAKSLIQPADLLILDEPTNHLDHDSVEWLEKYLRTYKGAILLVTHDRYFLNRVTNRIYELDHGKLYQYDGNYETFLEKKAEREAQELAAEQKHANTLRRELQWLKRGARARSTKQKARIQRVDELKQQTFQTKKEQLEFQVGSARLGKKVLEVKNITKSFGDKQVISNFHHLFIPGDRVGIIGPNGSGKTTLLNIMAKRLAPDSGEVETGKTVKIGYYTQSEEELDGELRVIDYIKETAEIIHTKDGEVITAEQMLERFLFSRNQQYSYIRTLSGGEKRRLYLLKILMTEPNVLFLDEPTNDLDIQTLSVLEDYLHYFPGVVITVSHDRYFLDRVVEQLLVFKGNGKIDLFYGNYSDHVSQEEQEITEKPIKSQTSNKPQSKKKKLSYLEKKEWDEIEDVITSLEEKVEAIEQQIADAGSDIEQVQSLYKEQRTIEQKLEEKMDRWEELSLLIEEISN
ncbi:ABC-F family ATP-binding cassette domain-containing protein [Cerasibacillus terrae]|uniref:ABC-F family ATP-binding cassette domain-containing protein n=1 Tax=Cerasibacillus terrae TaxID=2498845 RepID=A0A5C8NWZ2_9BACI|nr:ABC-F family ATP-binding cassette domain-containing protein [Cerasibacillus terrae]TXL65798.1 ABC-F family ATP-binding cassette domain-containing protein [Cerasibacillus terrae]